MSKLTTISLTDELRSKIDKYNKSNSEKIEISKLSRWVIKLFFASEGKFNEKIFDDIVQKLKNDVEEYRENNGENESKELLKVTIENLQEFLDLLGIKYTFDNEEMSRKNRNSAKYWYDKGIILQTQNRIKEALVAYNHAIEIDPNNEYAWYNKGGVLEELMEFDDAVDAYIQVSKINPNNADAWFSQGFIDCCEYNAYLSAIEVLNKALKISPNHFPSLYYKGMALSELNRIEEAIDCYAKIIDIEPAITRNGESMIIGLNVNALMYHGGYTRNNMFGLRFDYKTFIFELVNQILKDKNQHILLIPHNFGPMGDVNSDPDACQEILSKFQNAHKERIHLVATEYNQYEIKAVIGKTDFFIGSRMHACIAAISQGIPTMAVAYSRKFEGVFESIGFGEMVIDARNTEQEEALNRVVDSLQDQPNSNPKILEQINQARDQIHNHFKTIVQ